ncbi:hypothetical protein R5R35_013412 [Gryllus longicercus]
MGGADSWVDFRDITIRAFARNKYFVSGILDIKKALKEPMLLREKIVKCKSAIEMDSCADFIDVRVSTLCSRLKDKSAMWSGFVNHLKSDKGDFNRECPIEPGTYIISNYSYDQGEFEALPAMKGYWRSRSELEIFGLNGKKRVACFDVEAELQEIVN